MRDATFKGVIFDFDGQVLSRGIELVEKSDQDFGCGLDPTVQLVNARLGSLATLYRYVPAIRDSVQE